MRQRLQLETIYPRHVIDQTIARSPSSVAARFPRADVQTSARSAAATPVSVRWVIT